MAEDSSNSGRNRRGHLRYRDPQSTVLHFCYKNDHDEDSSFVGLIINESFKGLAVVFVGDGNFNKGDAVVWKETPNIDTACTVIRCQRLEEDVYSLALRIED